jgi:hypothetical protein
MDAHSMLEEMSAYRTRLIAAEIERDNGEEDAEMLWGSNAWSLARATVYRWFGNAVASMVVVIMFRSSKG